MLLGDAVLSICLRMLLARRRLTRGYVVLYPVRSRREAESPGKCGGRRLREEIF